MFESQIESAAAWLDVRYAGWAHEIDLENFNIARAERCVGGYLGVPWEQLAVQYRQDTGNLNVHHAVFATGQDIWKEEIRMRQAMPAPAKKPNLILAGLASLAGLAIF